MARLLVAVFGPRGSGKTTLIEEIVRRLSGKYRVLVIKHAKSGVSLDVEGKDTWRARKAGAHAVCALSGKEAMMLLDVEDPNPLEMIPTIERLSGRPIDVVIFEGFRGELGRRSDVYKIVILRGEEDIEYVSDIEEPAMVISSKPVNIPRRINRCRNVHEVVGILLGMLEESRI